MCITAQALPVMARGAQAMSGLAPGFERRSRPIDPAPVRHGFIPEGWFTMFYPKTGATGLHQKQLGHNILHEFAQVTEFFCS